MPRKPRFNLVGIPQHVIQRGNNREPCFYVEEDYRRYLNDLQELAKKFNCRIHIIDSNCSIKYPIAL